MRRKASEIDKPERVEMITKLRCVIEQAKTDHDVDCRACLDKIEQILDEADHDDNLNEICAEIERRN